MQVMKIQFGINKSAGELEFRRYHTSEEVNGKMYVVISKVTSDNHVNFHLYAVDMNGPQQLTDSTLTMEKFDVSMKLLESDLQKANPSVRLMLSTEESVAITNLPGVENSKVPSEVADAISRLSDMGVNVEALISNLIEKNLQRGPSSRIRKHM